MTEETLFERGKRDPAPTGISLRLTSDARRNIRSRLLDELSRSDTPEDGPGLEQQVEEAAFAEGYLLPGRIVSELARELADELFGMGSLEALMRDPEITEIMLNGPDGVFIERKGRIEPTEIDLGSPSKVIDIVRRVIGPLNLRLDETSPMVDARLPDGSRLNAVVPPLSLRGPVVTIRRFRSGHLSAEDLVGNGTMTAEIASFLKDSVGRRTNMLISGGTSSGKTTLLGVLASFIPPRERLITIEDAAELRIDHPHVIPLESRPPNIEGRGEVTVRDLVRNALRMRPDRIIVGEVRGAECLDMLQAMNTGHPGSLSTAHANSPLDLLARLETMVLMSDLNLDAGAVRRQIASALDLIIHMEKTPAGGRVVAEVASVSEDGPGCLSLETLFARDRRKTGIPPTDLPGFEPAGEPE